MEQNCVSENIFNDSAHQLLTLTTLEKMNIFYQSYDDQSIENQSIIHVRNLIRYDFNLYTYTILWNFIGQC